METKREFHLFVPFKINHWLSHIEYMASQGFTLSKMNDFFWTYQKTPPENRTYTAVSTGSMFYFIAPNPEQQQRISETFQNDGFTPSVQIHNIQLFYTTKQQPFSLSASSANYLENTMRSIKNMLYFNIVVYLFLLLFMGSFLLTTFLNNPLYVLTNLSSCSTYICFPIAMLAFIIQYLLYIPTAKKNIACIQSGQNITQIPTIPYKIASVCDNVAYVALIIMIGIFLIDRQTEPYSKMIILCAGILPFIYLGIVSLLQHTLKHRFSSETITKYSLASVAIIAFLFFIIQTVFIFNDTSEPTENDIIRYAVSDSQKTNHDFPLYMTDFIDNTYGIYTIYQTYQASPFVAQYKSYHDIEHANRPYLHYTITDVYVPIFFDICKNSLVSEEMHTITVTGCDTALMASYDYGVYVYLLTKHNRILYISSDILLDTQQLEIASKKLFDCNINYFVTT